MNLSQFSGTSLIELDIKATNADEVLTELTGLLANSDKVVNAGIVREALAERERLASTGLGFGIALPHARSKAVRGLTIAFGRSEKGVDFRSLDREPVHLFFAIVVPDSAVNTHLTALAKLSLLLKEKENREFLLNSTFPQEVLDFMDQV